MNKELPDIDYLELRKIMAIPVYGGRFAKINKMECAEWAEAINEARKKLECNG